MTEATHASLGWRTAFAATLALSMGIGTFSIVAVSALSPMVVPELGLTRTQFGSMATVAFGVAAATSMLGGRQVDVFSGRVVLITIFVTGGAAAAAMASAQSMAWLWIGATLAGLAQAVANPVTNKLIAEHIPAGRQGLQIGVKQSGVPMSNAVGGFTLPPLALLVGWRGSILLGLALAALGMLAVWAIIPRSEQSVSGPDSAPKLPLDRMVWWLTGYACMVAMTTTTVILYVPLYSFERVGLGAAVAGLATGVVGAVGIAGRILWGRIAERRSAPIVGLRVIAAVSFLSVLLVLASEYAGPWVLWPGLVGFGASAMAANAVVMLAVIRGAGAGRTGRATGIVGMGLFLGFMSGPLVFGALVDGTDSYTVGWAVVSLTSLLALATTFAWQRSARGTAGA